MARADWTTLARVNALTYDMIFTQPVVEEFNALTLPTALILGTRDRTAPGRANKREGVSRELGRYDKLGGEVKLRNKHSFIPFQSISMETVLK